MRFRFIDEVLSYEDGNRPKLVTSKAFGESEEYTIGHPQRPGEVPTCLILETLATSGVRLVYAHTGERVIGVLARVEEARIYSPVCAGDRIVIHTELLGLQGEARESVGFARTNGTASIGDKKVAEGRLTLLCFPKEGFEAAVPW